MEDSTGHVELEMHLGALHESSATVRVTPSQLTVGSCI